MGQGWRLGVALGLLGLATLTGAGPAYEPGEAVAASGPGRATGTSYALSGVRLAEASPSQGRANSADKSHRLLPPAGLARYWVSFTDKTGVRFDPNSYFTEAARARRRRQGLPPGGDPTDWPVRADYLAAVRAGADTVTVVSRWLNGVACRATPAQAAALARLPGVAQVRPWPPTGALRPARFSFLGSRCATSAIAATNRKLTVSPQEPKPDDEKQITKNEKRETPISPADYQLARRQTAVLGRAALLARGLQGEGVVVAVFDAGFRGLGQHPAFRELRRARRIAATYDFLKNRTDVTRGGAHGTEVLGCLAGRLPGPDSLRAGPALGLAPAATYLLARTEGTLTERYSEEEAWLRAAEWADQQGADIISSSLAYTERRYFPEQMDGRHSLIGRAATRAARKGILVVSAAGNDGDDDWVRIGTPADADSVLAVGGLDPATGLHAPFSSVGPAADRRLKPDLAAFGTVLTATARGGFERLEGTSFAAPLVAGLAACAVQAAGGRLRAGQLYGRLRAAGELFPYYDYAHGYGRPLAQRLLDKAAPAPPAPTFDFVAHDTLVAVVLRPAATLPAAQPLPLLAEADELSPATAAWLAPTPAPGPADPQPVGREQPSASAELPAPAFAPCLYWHLADRRGVLRRYEVRAVGQRLVLQVPRRLVRGGNRLRVWFGGYVGEYAE